MWRYKCMNNEADDIRRLLARYMDGETTVAENDWIAQWFRAHPEVDDDLRDYQALFNYVDEGMPWDFADEALDVQGTQMPHGKHKSRMLWLSLSVAASLALLLGVFWPRMETKGPLVSQQLPSTATAQVDSTSHPIAEPTKTIEERTDLESAKEKPQIKAKPRKYHKNEFAPSPPKVELAAIDMKQAEDLAYQAIAQMMGMQEAMLSALSDNNAEMIDAVALQTWEVYESQYEENEEY